MSIAAPSWGEREALQEGETMKKYACLIAAGLCLSICGRGQSQPPSRGDEIRKLKEDIAKLKNHLQELENRLKKLSAPTPSTGAGQPRPPEAGRPGGPPARGGFSRFGGFGFGGPPMARGSRGFGGFGFGGPPMARGFGGTTSAPRPTATRDRVGDIERRIDQVIKELEGLRKDLKK